MAEFVGGEPISVGIDEPITFENKTDTAFDVCCGIVFRKSGLYRVSIVGRHTSVAVEPERKRGEWIKERIYGRGIHRGLCSCCGFDIAQNYKAYKFCPHCGADMRGGRMDILKLREGRKLLAKIDELNNRKREYVNFSFRVTVGARYLDITKEEEETVRKLFMDKLDAEIAEIEQKIAEL